ncbi:hypothetical protein CH333_02980 [candidate division WOR-3 bacterium JGI_Cruoil_03_44_89]|uniref:Hydrogenase maturation protease n=1 Tax=candidate division WOR-3 bacterium JGI_Cruoil_03_44_89 TaxID=1973748 RepID=A0A235BW63_UNCW3|nr:MAG: hypothetical protein CH333_02980 [candidate division WOR-3 bacterium JGI_Cruoil_03_44_89]
MTPYKKFKNQISKIKSIVNGTNFLIAGVGNELKEIDRIGVELARKGEKIYPDRFIDCGVAPENYLHEIIGRKIETLIIVDVVYFENEGDMKILMPGELALQGISTHSLSLNFMAEYLANWGIKTVIIGIKPTPKNKEVGEKLLSGLYELIAAETRTS